MRLKIRIKTVVGMDRYRRAETPLGPAAEEQGMRAIFMSSIVMGVQTSSLVGTFSAGGDISPPVVITLVQYDSVTFLCGWLLVPSWSSIPEIQRRLSLFHRD